MRALKVVREPGVRWVIAQGGLEPVSRRPPLRDEPANRYPVTRDDDGLAMLDSIEDASKAPRRLRGRHCDHEYTLSDLVCLYVYRLKRTTLGGIPDGRQRRHDSASGHQQRCCQSRMKPASTASCPK